jgi:Tannase and feruloyl esterase
MNKALVAIFAAALFSSVVSGQDKPARTAQSCEAVMQLSMPQVRIASAQMIEAGALPLPAGMSQSAPAASLAKALPEFCRVIADATPTADSDIKIEVWMPAHGWNGKFQAQGNGGFAGSIDYFGMGAAITRGYASAGTDTGHTGEADEARWALGHPEKLVDFGYRAIHEMTQVAKAAVKAFYGQTPQHSYFGSCSNGGREALMEAQRFPDDYDGILAGAPANFWTHLLASALWDAQALTAGPGSYIPSAKIPAIAAAVNAACDAQDGVTDGIINDPRKCHFDPAALLCQNGDSDSCLTAPQVTTLKKLYEGAHDSRGQQVFPGFLPGAEGGRGGWEPWIFGSAPGKSLVFAFGTGYFSDIVYNQPDWNYKDAKLDDALKAADDKTARILNSADPNLAAFQGRGGKLIMYHGWNDPAISALNSINYYNNVVRSMGDSELASFMRLYMVPGMQHCGGGPGPFRFGEPGSLKPPTPNDPQHNVTLALEQWVEKGAAPSTIISSKYTEDDPAKGIEMTRPLCPYPQSAKYKGSGNSNDAANFVCADK